jgi:hypothetical protein
MEILNSEGPIMTVERIDGSTYLKIKLNNGNQYAYFPISREQLESYFDPANEITTGMLLIELGQFAFIDSRYNELQGAHVNIPQDILNWF